MAEALAIIGLTSALVQFIDFGSKVVRQLRRLESDMEDMPLVFRNVRSRLPLMLDVVRKLMLQMDAGLVQYDSQETMLPVVRACVLQAEQLDALISKALPRKDESAWSRGKKAVMGVIAEPEVEKIDAALKVNFDLLAQTGTFRLATKNDSSKTGPSMFDMSGATVNVTLLQNKQQAMQQHLLAPSNESEQWKDPAPPTHSIFLVPFQRDANFLGRNATLDLIEQKLGQQNSVALSGLGGIGKSQIAIEYSYIFKERHPESHVFWVWGSNPTRFGESYHQIAKKLAIRGVDDHEADVLQLVHDELNSEECVSWLFILDNADDAFMYYPTKSSRSDNETRVPKSYARYLPNNSKGSILVTTRDKRVGERLCGRQRPIVITAMTADESKELLQSKISEENWCEDDAAELVAELSCLPLAITQAAAFISENNFTVSEYLEILRAGEEDIKELLSEHLEDPRRDLDSENSVMRTWKLSFDQIAKGCERAAQMLSLISVLDWHAVPLILLRRQKETETGLRIALGTLQAFSLVTAGRGKDANCKMHRLAALSTQKWLELSGSLGEWRSEALRVLSVSFPGPGGQRHADWAVYEALTPHTSLILSLPFSTTEDLLQCAKLQIAVGLYSLSRGRYAEAFKMCSKSLEIRQRLLPEDDPLLLDSVQTLGETLLHRGEFLSARTMLQRAVTGRNKALGARNADTLESLSDLTITLLELDDLPTAEEACLKALSGRRQILGEAHPDTLVSSNIMAILHHREGHLQAAKDLYETVLQRRQILLGHDHPDTLMTHNNLARLCYDQGDLKAASQAFDIVLAGEEKHLGAEGYDIQVSLSNKALVLAAKGEYGEAQGILAKVLEMRERLLGRRHPTSLFTVAMMVEMHKQSGGEDATAEMHRLESNTGEKNVASAMSEMDMVTETSERRMGGEGNRINRGEVDEEGAQEGAREGPREGRREAAGALLQAGLLFD